MASIKRAVVKAATIDLNHVATWVRVVEAGSFTAAALAQGVPKSSVSRAIQKLEDDLGLTLLQRTTRKLTLTRAGERYLASAREALRLLHDGHADVMNEDGALRGLVRITTPYDNGPLSRALGTALVQLKANHPGLSFDVLITGRRVDLVAENVDLALRAGALDESDLVAKKLTAGSLAFVASPGYLKQRGVPKRLRDLAQHDVILFRATEGSQRLKLSGPSGTESVSVTGAINVDDMIFQLPLVENGAGIALLPTIVVDEMIATGRLVRVLPQYSRKDASLYLVSVAPRLMSKRVALVRDFLYEHLSRELAPCSRLDTRQGP